jgi:hypothetical protein
MSDAEKSSTFADRARSALAGVFLIPASARDLIIDLCEAVDLLRANHGDKDAKSKGN